MTATFAAFTHAAHRSTAFAAPPRSGVMAETAPTPNWPSPQGWRPWRPPR
ncbi:hypothetical protein [Brevundimonas goettingensis]|uniref:Uncharacterized protein n=1 Tax=Brevundimonas goettingensis TaxID=2774190 RepID=A0A975GX97_9CAUL|nr:hypothetical protein [Brevundimonas goettingensis]QTC93432.1 hypothetical protein IFJ75_15275 [Brevundimonas goettingensis]